MEKRNGRCVLTLEAIPDLTMRQWKQVMDQYDFSGSAYPSKQKPMEPIYIDDDEYLAAQEAAKEAARQTAPKKHGRRILTPEEIPDLTMRQWKQVMDQYDFSGSAYPSKQKPMEPIYIDDDEYLAAQEAAKEAARQTAPKKHGRRILTPEEIPDLTIRQWKQVMDQYDFSGSAYPSKQKPMEPIYIDDE